MKNLTLIIHSSMRQAARDLLIDLAVDNFTFIEVEGHGVNSQLDQELSSRDRVVGYVPRLRIDVLVEDSNLTKILESFKNSISSNSAAKQTNFWVTEVSQNGIL